VYQKKHIDGKAFSQKRQKFHNFAKFHFPFPKNKAFPYVFRGIVLSRATR